MKDESINDLAIDVLTKLHALKQELQPVNDHDGFTGFIEAYDDIESELRESLRIYNRRLYNLEFRLRNVPEGFFEKDSNLETENIMEFMQLLKRGHHD